MTHIANLRSILTDGCIRSYNSMRGRRYLNLANDDVQAGRAGIVVPASQLPLHNYVPLYFGFKTPMVACNQDQNKSLVFLRVSLAYLWEDDRTQILNFPTKGHWREGSRLQDIDAGLQYLADHYQDLGICSVAMPLLGCGNGGLNWKDVRRLIEERLGEVPDLEVFVYEPPTAGVKAQDIEESDLDTTMPFTDIKQSAQSTDDSNV